MSAIITYQGEPGAFSHLACQTHYPDLTPKACLTFEEATQAVERGAAVAAMIPVENSVAGRVADVHHLMPDSRLYITAEHFVPVRHQLLGLEGAPVSGLTHIHSHPMALAQCHSLFRRLPGVRAVRDFDTAGAAQGIAERGDPTQAALASSLAGEIYALSVLERDVQDDPDNTTRFLVMAREPARLSASDGPFVTSLLFRVRNVSGALYKALGGFATNGVNMTKLESYQVGGLVSATQFYADVDGHPDDPPLRAALEELEFFCARLRLVGTYRADPYRAGRNPAR